MKFREYKKFIKEVNPDNYQLANIEARTEEELKEKVKLYFEDLNEYEDEDEVEIEFNGEGVYDIVGIGYIKPCIQKIESIVERELEAMEFPFNLNKDFFENNEKWVGDIKKEERYDYIYLIVHSVLSNDSNTIKYVVKSNVEMSARDIEDYFEEHDIECEEFEVFFANHDIFELEELSLENIANFKGRGEYIFIE